MRTSDETSATAKKAMDLLGMKPKMQKLLTTPKREVCVELPVERDNGDLEIYMGYRVQHNNARGPMKGGLRYHPLVDSRLMHHLASLMTWATALADVPMGGSMGGIACDPKALSDREQERLTRTYVSRVHELIGPIKDITSPDVNTSPKVMAWMLDEYSKFEGFKTAVVTGKPLALQGSRGRAEAGGFGVATVVREALRDWSIPLTEASFAFQGFGNVGYHASRFLQEAGARVLAVTDSGGGVYSGRGLDIDKLRKHSLKKGTVAGFPGGDPISNDELFALKCDVLVAAALGEVFRPERVNDLKASVVVEAAPGASTPEGEEALARRGIKVIPDLVASAGSVVADYHEWVQNLQQLTWTKEKAYTRLEEKVKAVWAETKAAAEERKIPLRLAAFVVAVGRVLEAMELRGAS
ncbi:MAG: glutamate dehydrogenase [Planctomycetes bacterium]|nr:glutamate dehydrogenase [Planctomycetota bacterium]